MSVSGQIGRHTAAGSAHLGQPESAVSSYRCQFQTSALMFEVRAEICGRCVSVEVDTFNAVFLHFKSIARATMSRGASSPRQSWSNMKRNRAGYVFAR